MDTSVVTTHHHLHLSNALKHEWVLLLRRNKVFRLGVLCIVSCLLQALSACSIMSTDPIQKSAEVCLCDGGEYYQQVVYAMRPLIRFGTLVCV